MISNYKVFILYLFVFISQLSSIRFFYTYNAFRDQNSIFFYLIFVFFISLVFIFFYEKNYFKIFLNKKFFYFILLLIFFLGSYFYFQSEELVKINLGLDQDNCIKDLTRQFFINFKYQYELTYLGNPCSTGPLFVLLYLPYLLLGNFIFIIYCIICLLAIQYLIQIFNYKLSYILIYTLIANLIFLELAFAGSDFFVIGTLFILFIHNSQKNNLNNIDYMIFFLSSLFFYSSRVLFLILSVFFLIYFFLNNNKSFKIQLLHLLSIFISLLIYLFFALINQNFFHPYHLFSKIFLLITFIFNNYIFSIIFFFIFVIFVYYFRSINVLLIFKKKFFPISLFIFSITIFIFSRVGTNDFKIVSWEELNYFLLILPSLVYLFIYFDFDNS